MARKHATDNVIPYKIQHDDHGVTLICPCSHTETVAGKALGVERTAAAGRMMQHVKEAHGKDAVRMTRPIPQF